MSLASRIYSFFVYRSASVSKQRCPITGETEFTLTPLSRAPYRCHLCFRPRGECERVHRALCPLKLLLPLLGDR